MFPLNLVQGTILKALLCANFVSLNQKDLSFLVVNSECNGAKRPYMK